MERNVAALSQNVVFTAIGADRPGLVERLARVVAEHGGNWLDARMARLGGQFAGIVQVEVATDAQPALVGALGALAAHGLTVVVAPTSPPAPRVGHAVLLELVGADQPGIVREVTAAIASLGANVEALTSGTSSAPMTGEALFHLRAELFLPVSQTVEALRVVVERLASDLMVDITLE